MKFKLLDHGYCDLVETWGSDERIVEAARMSTQKGFVGWGGAPCPECDSAGRLSPKDRLFLSYADSEAARLRCGTCRGTGKTSGDEKLLRYLYENKHSTPFEMAGLTIEVQAPIFVFREWHRHRVPFSYNEASARYAPLPDLNYIPTVERLMMGGGHLTKQAGTVAGAETLTEAAAERFREALAVGYDALETGYQAALRDGISKELARILLPVGRYSKMRASANLRGWLAFMALRSAPKAQYEIRVYSDAVGKLIEKHFPRTWELFAEGQLT